LELWRKEASLHQVVEAVCAGHTIKERFFLACSLLIVRALNRIEHPRLFIFLAVGDILDDVTTSIVPVKTVSCFFVRLFVAFGNVRDNPLTNVSRHFMRGSETEGHVEACFFQVETRRVLLKIEPLLIDIQT